MKKMKDAPIQFTQELTLPPSPEKLLRMQRAYQWMLSTVEELDDGLSERLERLYKNSINSTEPFDANTFID